MLSTPRAPGAVPVRQISCRDDTSGTRHPLSLPRSLCRHRDLLVQLLRRDIAARYRGAYLGQIWAFAIPILTLAVYTVVFGTIFKAPASKGGVGAYALSLFCGFVPWWLFAEVTGGAPTLILGRPNFVQKMAFPLELLPVVQLGVALFNSLAALVILLVALVVEGVPLRITLLWLPALYVPLGLWTLGTAFFLSAAGVFLRDLNHAVSVFLQLWFFATPIVYTVDMVPPALRFWLKFNPMTGIVDAFRQAAYQGQEPDLGILALLTGLGLLVLWLGYVTFMRSRRAFADVL